MYNKKRHSEKIQMKKTYVPCLLISPSWSLLLSVLSGAVIAQLKNETRTQFLPLLEKTTGRSRGVNRTGMCGWMLGVRMTSSWTCRRERLHHV